MLVWGIQFFSPKIDRKESDISSQERAISRAIAKLGGSEKACYIKVKYNDLVSNRQPVSCVHNTADEFLIALLHAGFSHIKLRSFFKLGGYKCNGLEQEMANPELKTQKLQSRNPTMLLQISTRII